MFKKITKNLFMLAGLLLITGCRSLPPLPAVDIFQPGWKTQRGQAVWKPKKDAAEIAGELLVATNANGRALVQFIKTPFPFAVAQRRPDAWQVEFPAVNKRFAAKGNPPQRIIWLQLPRYLAGAENSRQWAWEQLDEPRWRLRNRITGESLEGFLSP